MKYLIRTRGKKVKAHIWIGNDTACRMWSTGGLKQSRYVVYDEPYNGWGYHETCHMCRVNSESKEAA